MLICIDAGHGRHTPGKRCLRSIDPKETREWELNRRIADKLQKLLEGCDCQTMRVDDPTGERDIPLKERTDRANRAGAKFYLSIHHNAGINGGAGGGIVVYTGLGHMPNSEGAAEVIYRHLIAATGLRGNRAQPIAKQDLHVLRETKMAAVLVEHGFMDSTHDTPIILTEQFADQAARGLCEALAERFHLRPGAGEYKPGQPVTGCEDKVIQAARFGVALVDAGKRDCASLGCGDGYCNGGFFGYYTEKGEPFVLPVGHVLGDNLATGKWFNHYIRERGQVKEGKALFDSGSWPYANPLYGKALTTLIIKDGKARVEECIHIPTCDYALSGIPVIRNGKPVSSGTALSQGWDASSLRATWHRFVGLRPGEDGVHVMRIQTKSGNLLQSREVYDRLAPQGFTEVVKLDGGGSDYGVWDGRESGTPGNRRICSVVYEKPMDGVDQAYGVWLRHMERYQREQASA